jgi:Tetratricopeptide repeat
MSSSASRQWLKVRLLQLLLVIATPVGCTAVTHAGVLDDCMQDRDLRRVVAGCSALVESASVEDRTMAMALNNLGNAHAALDDDARAEADYTQAIAVNPGYANAYFNRSGVGSKLKQSWRGLS